jgi:hypothetical protein
MTLAVFRHFPVPIRTVSTPAAIFYYLSSRRHLVFQPRLPQALPRLGYDTHHFVFQTRLPQTLPRLRLERLQV